MKTLIQLQKKLELNFKCYLVYSLYVLCIWRHVTNSFLFKLTNKFLKTKEIIPKQWTEKVQIYLHQ